MPFNIDNFKANIEDGGYLPTNRFRVILTPPPILFNSSINNTGTTASIRNINSDMTYRIEQVKVPGITLMSADVARYGVGPTQKQPMNAQFGDNSFTILSDGYGDIWQFWHNWIRGIFEFTGTSSANFGQANRVPSYGAEYKDQYSTTMQIIVYDNFGNAIQKVNMFEAFPNSLREVGLNWADGGNLLKLNVGISYTEYTIESSNLEPQQAQIFGGAGAQFGPTITFP